MFKKIVQEIHFKKEKKMKNLIKINLGKWGQD